MADSCGINNPTSTLGVRSPNPPRIYKAVVGGAPANTFMPIGIRPCDLYYDGFNDNVYMFIGASGGLATWELITGGAFVLPLAVSSGGTGDTSLTAHNVLIGEGTSPVAFAAPSATVGVPLVSAGAAADPAFGTAVVAGGGTGATTLTAHGVLMGEGTSPVVASSAGTAGQVFTSGGASADGAYAALGTNSGLTAHGVLVGEGNSPIAALAVGTTGQTLMGSTGADPAFTGSPSFSGSVTAGTTITATSGAITATNGNLVLGTEGNKLVSTSVASTTTAGANSFGTVTLSSGTATISTTAVTASSIIMLTRQSPGSTGANPLGMLSVGTIVANTSFVINALTTANSTTNVATDVSVVGWMIIN